MFGQQITELELRNKLLLLESSQNRFRLLTEFQQLQSSAPMTLVGSLTSAVGRLGPWALALGAVAGLAGATGLRNSFRNTGILGKALALAPVAMKLWRAFKGRSEESREQ
jgi:hypothetical protein